jgi:hypothetical protein
MRYPSRYRRVSWPAAILTLAIILLAAAGCGGVGVGAIDETRTETLAIDYPAGDQTPQLALGFGAARLHADGQGTKLLEGTVRYNVVGLKPETTTFGSRVEVRQSSNVTPSGMINEWDIHIGKSKPIMLEVNAGAYEGNWDLGGIPLRELTINQGASNSTLDFSQPNPTTMSRLQVRTGAAALTLKNLCNAGFERMLFEGGASAYTLDFGGILQRDAYIEVRTGLSDLNLVLPPDVPAQIRVRESITAVDADPGLVSRGRYYYTPAWDSGAGPRLTIDVTMGMGHVGLRLGRPSGAKEI